MILTHVDNEARITVISDKKGSDSLHPSLGLQSHHRRGGPWRILRCIGLLYYMATFFSPKQFWSAKKSISFESAPVRFSCCMLIVHINYSPLCILLAYADQYHQVRQVIRAWNENMAKVFAFLLAITEINLFMVHRDFRSAAGCQSTHLQ
jgi:hypothetical protein